MPIEVLTREDVEKIVEERLSRVISELTALRNSLDELRGEIRAREAQPAQTLTEMIARDTAQWADLVEIKEEAGLVIIRPKHYLSSSAFRSIGDIVRRYRGNWNPERRAFLVWKQK